MQTIYKGMVSHAEVLMDLKNQHVYLKAMEIKKNPEIKVEVKNEGKPNEPEKKRLCHV